MAAPNDPTIWVRLDISIEMLGQPHLDCDCSHGICVSLNFVENGRMAESENWSSQQPLQAHTGDDDTFLFSMRGLPRPVSWLGNHTGSAIAAIANDLRKPFMELTISLFLPLALSFHKKRCRPPESNVASV
ncbi:hypothetical protein Tco_1059045 [Tanacetum coccineum]